ncbi:MAG: glycosyltransferase family 4 protein [Anaerorhabdus sp.]|uniref:glycosyltransferase family 4 protein n=1 Tax=Anaerorhabdus sp. TaxID=1872524 RepID=UPI002FC9E481
MKKKIIVYLTSFDKSGGKERVVANLLKSWKDKYDITIILKINDAPFYAVPKEVDLICIDAPCTYSMFDLKISKIKRIYFSVLNSIYSMRKLKKILKLIEYDYIYITTPLNGFECFVADNKNAKNKLVVSEHASINAYNMIYSLLKKIVYPRSYCVSVPNKTDVEEYLKWGCNAFFIPHLVTFKAISRNKLDTKIMLNVGRLTKDKQQDVLLELWAKINDKKGWRLLIVGDGEEKENLEKLIDKLNLRDTVTLKPAQKNVENIYKNASAFIITSRTEGFGMVLIEAMSFGIPCISFNCPSGPRDIIIDNENGFLVENKNKVEMINTINKIIDMRQENLITMGETAFNSISSWDNDKIFDQWDKIFK